jgi:hypothetical protein
MTWGEIAELSADPLVTIGGHSVSHTALATISEDRVRFEMRSSVAIIETALGGARSTSATRLAIRPRRVRASSLLPASSA